MTDDLACSLALSHVPGVGSALFRALCARFGGARDVFRTRAPELERVRGLRRETIDALLDGRARIRAAELLLNRLHSAGVQVITSADASYPARLLDLRDPPPILYLRGALPRPEDKTFSVAGSSMPSARASELARILGAELARAAWTVVSGYAFGIDTAAHLGALEQGGRTVLVLPMGICTFDLHPEFRRFRARLGKQIILMSESDPDAPWSARNAVMRDRLIAALGDALLVVEARAESGTMITFRHAVRLGRPAYVIRYRHRYASADGNVLAIRRGGLPVRSMAAFRAIISARALPRAVPRVRQAELF